MDDDIAALSADLHVVARYSRLIRAARTAGSRRWSKHAVQLVPVMNPRERRRTRANREVIGTWIDDQLMINVDGGEHGIKPLVVG